MRIHCRLLLGMFGLALAIPMAAAAAPFGDDDGANAVAAGQPQPAPHTHKGLFGRRHCVECQRAYVKAHDGVDVPAPPPIAPGVMMNGQVMPGQVMPGQVMAGQMIPGQVIAGQTVVGQGAPCSVCQGNGVVTGPVMIADANAPGYAVVGGPGMMVSSNTPGYAVVGEAPVGQDPAPIGVFRAGQAPYGDPRMAAMGPRPGAGGAYDPAVVPTSIPPAPVAMEGPEHERRYKVIAHAIGVPKFGSRRRAEADKERQKHAAISYNQPDAKVTDLPASMVYGKGDH